MVPSRMSSKFMRFGLLFVGFGLTACQPKGDGAAPLDSAPDDVACVPDAEACDGVDNDCDGSVDEDDAVDATLWHVDADDDGYGVAGASDVQACAQPDGFVADATDCNDLNGAVSPGAGEACNGIDDNCDGGTDEAGAAGETAWYADADSDDFGGALIAESCDAPDGSIAQGGDCDDTNRFVNPSGTESCNGIDDDCDGTTDEAGAAGETWWYADTDGDGYGGTTSAQACDAPDGYVGQHGDCDEANGAVSPAAIEACNGVDDDCDGHTDEAGATGETTWYPDADSDGYGGATGSTISCDAPAGHVARAGDCDEALGTVNPDATEICDGVDNDCTAVVDDTIDVDGDGEYDCTDPDDSDARIYTGAIEVCDGVDNDVDGYTDASGQTGSFTANFGDTSYLEYGQHDGTFGNYYYATGNARIEEVQMYGDAVLWSVCGGWWVYEATSLTGTYTQIAASSGASCWSDNTYDTWASSGALDADIVAGRYYFVAVTTDDMFQNWDGAPDLSEQSGLVPIGWCPLGFTCPGTVSTTALFVQVITLGPSSENEDADIDGVTGFCGDCDDADGGVSPDESEVCADGIDQDCDGSDCP